MRAEDVLADNTNEASFNGLTVRKGTVGAFLANVHIWRNAESTHQDRQIAERDIIDAVPALRAIGLFDVLQPIDPQLSELIAKG